jgi:hypothetical protein
VAPKDEAGEAGLRRDQTDAVFETASVDASRLFQ